VRALFVSLVIAGCAAPPPLAPEPPAPAPPQTCAVWDRELGFAKSVADHDFGAFADHVHPAAVFVDGDGKFLRGRQAIVDGWRTIIEGTRVALRWHPTAVIADGAPGVAISRGPYLIEDLRSNANDRFRKGTFQSIWIRDPDGVWRVFVDGGTPPPVPATPEEAEKLKAELHAPCAPSVGP
jgi:ketosteroid isomerase-like protein